MKASIIVFHWLPRIICIAAILFVSMFAADSFGSDLSIWLQLRDFLMHLIPTFILIAFLVIAWKWELVGGVVFSLVGIGLSPFIYQHNFDMNHSALMSLGIIMMITFPFFAVGVLFIISHFLKKANLQ